MEVYVYSQLVGDKLNEAFIGPKGGLASPYTAAAWENAIRSTKQAATDFDNIGYSDAANGWGGEYNGLSALQGTGGFKYMKEFLKSCGSMMTGAKDIGKARVGLYTIGMEPETWFAGTTITNYTGED